MTAQSSMTLCGIYIKNVVYRVDENHEKIIITTAIVLENHIEIKTRIEKMLFKNYQKIKYCSYYLLTILLTQSK
jgi:hypothetical protein